MENYICINGKKAELTEEQMKALGIEIPKNSPFERVCNHANDFYSYYFITSMGTVNEAIDRGFGSGNGNDAMRYIAGNYCTDESLMEQRALHETLSRLLWRYSMEHDGDNIALNHCWGIAHSGCCYEAKEIWGHIVGESVFYTRQIANNAIKEIVVPFMEAHPEFKW